MYVPTYPTFRVSELCEELGWGVDLQENQARRRRSKLSIATSEFRKRFYTEFPLDWKHEVAQECARKFCEGAEDWFVKDEEAILGGYLSLPDDQEKIIELLAKLFCTQAAYTRNNAAVAEATRDAMDKEDSVPLAFSRRNRTSRENSETEHGGISREEVGKMRVATSDEDIEPRTHVSGEQRSDAGSLPTKRVFARKLSSNMNQHLQASMEDHLNFAYHTARYNYDPCDMSEESEANDLRMMEDICCKKYPRLRWLFSGHWPEDVQSFVQQYMHDAGIYSTEPGNQEVEELVEGLIQYLRVNCNRKQRGLLSHKLTWYIHQCTQEWDGKGFLKKISVDGFIRSSIFEEMWKEWRDAWLHAEVPSSMVIEKNDSDPVQLKRQRESDDLPAVKRRKACRMKTNPHSKPFPAGPYDKFHKNYPPNRVRKAEPSRRSESRKASETIVVDSPIAPKVSENQKTQPAVPLARTSTTELELLPTPQKSSCPKPPLLHISEETTMKSMCDEIGTAAAAAGNPEPDSEAPEVSRGTANAQPDSTSAEDEEPGKSGYEQASNTVPAAEDFETMINLPLSKQSTPISVAEKDRAQLEPKVVQTNAQSSMSKTSPPTSIIEKDRVAESKPKIRFVIQNSKGTLDFRPDKLLPSNEFRDSSISDFFALYAHKSGVRLESIESLKFTAVFANNATMTVKKMDNESVWKTLKKRLSSLFSLTRMEDPEETDFEVYIRIGNMTEIIDEGEDEDFAGF